MKVVCAHPVTARVKGHGEKEVPCGKCMPCRVNARRKKTGRFLLEGLGHSRSAFVTLTYADEHLELVAGADGCPVWTVSRRTLRLCTQRARHLLGRRMRYVGVGEYGNLTGRPHYHLLAYGVDIDTARRVYTRAWRVDGRKGNALRGHVDVQPYEVERAAYTAGYTAKKLSRPDDERLVTGQQPEFMQQSLNPPIGGYALDWLEELARGRSWQYVMKETGDVPKVFRLNGRVWPFDRYIITKLRERMGVTNPPVQWQYHDPVEVEQAQLVHDKMTRHHRRGERF